MSYLFACTDSETAPQWLNEGAVHRSVQNQYLYTMYMRHMHLCEDQQWVFGIFKVSFQKATSQMAISQGQVRPSEVPQAKMGLVTDRCGQEGLGGKVLLLEQVRGWSTASRIDLGSCRLEKKPQGKYLIKYCVNIQGQPE